MEVCVQGSAPALTSAPNQATPRRSANFQPSLWGDHFLKYATDLKESFTDEEEIEHARLKEEIKKMLIEIPQKSRQKLDLIDAIQRLGLSYHFESEIEALLRNIYNAYHEGKDEDDNDLYVVSLRFRLLRQNGHYISCGKYSHRIGWYKAHGYHPLALMRHHHILSIYGCSLDYDKIEGLKIYHYLAETDVFNKFKNSEGKFKESMVNDLKGMLSLYEASDSRVHGETVLEEALMFTTSQLESMMPNLSDSKATEVKRALNLPIQKTLPRLGALHYITVYQEDETHSDALLNLARLDFNRVQKVHQMELCELTLWWKELDCERKLPFARDRLVESYFWVLGAYFEPRYGLARRFLTKVFAVTSIIDDINGVYGTLDELILFKDAIERWDIKAINQLPSYMRQVYQILLDVYNEMEEELAKRGIAAGGVDYVKEEMTRLVREYFQEACWFHNSYVPRFDEYMKASLITCGYLLMATASMVGMGGIATKEVFDWVTKEPLIVRASSIIARLMNDMVGHEIERERGDVASAVECYMKEYGASKKEAFDEFQKQVTNAWKDINKERLNPIAVPKPILERVLNLTRVLYVVYKDKDRYSSPTIKTKEVMAAVLVDPI